ncbi:MAG: hypothetical protein M1829_005569 [Trizodia sp. TS-e1964]|nr:MAG: hypothetical protein M1829_005569 [Trizodia sp. TS-e1964]
MNEPIASSPPPPTPAADPTTPSALRYVLSFLLVGLAWGFTTPFIRRAALSAPAPTHKPLRGTPSLKRHVLSALASAADLARRPAYTLPLVLNITGSVWFFLLIGQAGEFPRALGRDGNRGLMLRGAELSLTVPITNSLAFLFTVLGEWVVEGRRIERGELLGAVCGEE